MKNNSKMSSGLKPGENTDLQRELKKLQLMLDISQSLQQGLDLKQAVLPVLEKMSSHMGMLRGTITILNRETGQVEIDQAFGLSTEERSRGRYRLGEGVTGQVVKSGEPAVVRKISETPLFLDRTKTRWREIEKHCKCKDISFICVPVKIGNEVIGALSADRLFDESVSLEEDLKLLTIIASLIAQAVKLRREARERENALREEKDRLSGELLRQFKPTRIIGNSSAMRQICALIAQVAPSNATALITGESGVGKELVAEAIHQNSSRSEKPFIKVNLAALPETLIESELFGHEKGAFTGAIARRSGRFGMAEGGTLFLDEIGELSPAIQVKLLRVLQEKEYERVGGGETLKTDVRIIAATNRNLEELIRDRKFREDLYYRLNVFPIHVPPLRERRTDIILLADYFTEKVSAKHEKKVLRISTPAIEMLMSYHWPGNVRELENCIERAVLLSADGVIHGHHLPPSLQTAEASGTLPNAKLQGALDALEREMISDALKTTHGNMAKAATILGTTERLIGLRVKKFGINLANCKGGTTDPHNP
ncbi:MAG: sigma 54-interacting transcriptional regulator [Victivallales bacterium]